jgi:phosphate transport system protein
MPEHRQEFQGQLDAIETKVIELFAVVAEDLSEATGALLRGDGQMAELLAGREAIIDDLYHEIEQLAGREIALEAPVASDLRFLLAVLRVVPELERSHHLIVEIASRGARMSKDDLSARSGEIVEQMGSVVTSMWRQAADSWYQRDRSVAAVLSQRDDEMGDLHTQLIAEVSTGRMPVYVTVEMTLVARFYKRLGDHAVNVAQRVIYLAGLQHPPD